MGGHQAEPAGIVVLGAGYGGLRAAVTLAGMSVSRRGLAVTLVDREPTHQLITEIHRVAVGYLPPEAVRLPLDTVLAGTGVRFRQATVEALDVETRRVLLAGEEPLPYSHLVIALGSDVEDHHVEGARDHAFPLRSAADAERLLAHLQNIMDALARSSPGPERRALETVIVVGAGWTGTELAGELVSFRDARRRVGAAGGAARVILLEGGPSIMPGFSTRLRQAAHDFFARNGVDVRLNSMVAAVAPGRVVLADGTAVEGRTVIWTGGVRGHAMLGQLKLPLGRGGRLEVNSYLRVPGQSGIYAVGDCAYPPAEMGSHVPGPSAQLALHQAEAAAANLAADLTGRPPRPYRPFLLGEALSLGESDGATLVGPLLVSGRRALALKRAINLNYVRSLAGSGQALAALRQGV